MRSSYNTKLKQNILDYLTENENTSVSAKEIYQYLLSLGEQMNLSTVYRNLERLVLDKAVLKYVSDDGKASVYIWNNEQRSCCEHLHLQCISCGKLIHLDCECSDEFVKLLIKKHDFELKCDNTVLYGECGHCREKHAAKNK